MKTIEKIVDAVTGEESIVERDLTAVEVKELKAIEEYNANRKTEAEAKEAARQAVLTKLGLTAEEAQALLG